MLRTFPKLALVPLAFALLAAAPPPKLPSLPADDAPQPISVAVAPGRIKDAVRKLLLTAYARATATVLGDPAWDGSAEGLAKLQANHLADLVLVDGPILATACRAQTITKLDWSVLGRDRFLSGAATDCGAGAYLSATVLAWDAGKLAGIPGEGKLARPPAWGDFWDVAKYPGRRGLRRGARGNLEIALLADGVAAGDVYRTLRSADGVDRAFRKLDQLKPYIIWWDEPGQPAQLLTSAKVLLTSAGAASFADAHKAQIGVQWGRQPDGSVELGDTSRRRPSTRRRGRLLVVGDSARQADFARASGLGPPTRTAFALMPPDARPQSPSLPANLQAGLAIDEGFWLDNTVKLEARFAAWIGK